MSKDSLPPIDSDASGLLTGDHRFQLLVNAIKDYAIYLLDEQGRVSSWNTGAQRLKGYTADEILGQHFSRFYTPEDIESGVPELALATARAKGKFEAQGWRVRKDGTRFWTSVHIEPVLDPDGGLIGFAKVTRDMSEILRAQDEMDRARDALAQAQKLEAIGRLTGGVAHDFNNLLTIIRSSAELLRKTGHDEVRRERYVQAIADAADRAALLTRQLLAFARQQPLRPEIFRADSRIKAMTQMIETILGPKVSLEMQFDDPLGQVEADASQFDRAILNMVINAKDAMPDGGRLKISARNADEVPPVRADAAAHGEFVALSIEDTGSGIEPAALGRIFEPFFTTKPVNKGTGLGLSQAYGFAQQSGGEIEVVSRVGEGTCFTLYLPLTTKSARIAEADALAQGTEPTRPLSILIVEDNDELGEFGLDLLAEMGHSATRAVNASEALRILQERHAEFDLVFSDVVMPGTDGVELAKEIRLKWPDLPVVLTSGYSHVLADDRSREFKLVHKPYSLRELQALFERAMPEARR